MSIDLGYASHFPILAACIARTTMNGIVELGAGWGSTPLIHYSAKDRYALTADTDPTWIKTFAMYARPDAHEFAIIKAENLENSKGVLELTAAWESFVREIRVIHPSVVLVDQAPGEARVPCARLLKGYAHFIVCHDTEADEPPGGGNYGWKELDGLFKYKTTMKRIRPWTTVYSDAERFPIEACDAE